MRWNFGLTLYDVALRTASAPHSYQKTVDPCNIILQVLGAFNNRVVVKDEVLLKLNESLRC